MKDFPNIFGTDIITPIGITNKDQTTPNNSSAISLAIYLNGWQLFDRVVIYLMMLMGGKSHAIPTAFFRIIGIVGGNRDSVE